MSQIPSPECLRFRTAIGRRFGLGFHDHMPEALDQLLAHTAAKAKVSPIEYVERLESNQLSPEELKGLLGDVTVGETYFFRHPDQFRALREVALPERIRERGPDKRLSVLSAGCASGEEAYSLAAALLETVDPFGWSLRVVGFDVNPLALRRATDGRYTKWSLRSTPDDLRARYFHKAGRDFIVAESLRRLTSFHAQNLADAGLDAGESGEFDVVFFRNVMMYFTNEAAALAVSRLTRRLAPGGYLFLGPAETLRGLSHDFHLRHTHDTFYYQRRDASPRPRTPLAPRDAATVVLPNWSRPPELDLDPPASPGPIAAEEWMTAIEQSTERVARLSRQVQDLRPRENPTAPTPKEPTPTKEPAPTVAPSGADDLAGLAAARGLIEQESFDDARRLMQTLSSEMQSRPEALLLTAVALTNAGAAAEARVACERLLEGDELNPEGHYLYALCCEQAGDLDAAAAQDETACYLDPQFAMPRLHLGRLAKRQGRKEAAAEAYQRGLELLAAEEPSRIALFGGGFSREALTQVFLADLKVCGGRRD